MLNVSTVVLFFAFVLVICRADPPPADQVYKDIVAQQQYLKCQELCSKQETQNEQICKILENRKLVATPCMVNCLKISKEEADNAKQCKCVNGKCIEEGKNLGNSGNMVKFIPEIFAVLFVVYSAINVM